MKFIKVIDSYAISESRYVEEFLQSDNSFLVMVDDNEYELLKQDLQTIIDNLEDYDSPYDEMMETINEYDARIIYPDAELEW